MRIGNSYIKNYGLAHLRIGKWFITLGCLGSKENPGKLVYFWPATPDWMKEYRRQGKFAVYHVLWWKNDKHY